MSKSLLTGFKQVVEKQIDERICEICAIICNKLYIYEGQLASTMWM